MPDSTSASTGRAQVLAPPGLLDLTVSKEGFVDVTTELTLVAGEDAAVTVTMEERPTVEEEVIVVASTRTGRRLEDQPTRVEVIGREEIEEKFRQELQQQPHHDRQHTGKRQRKNRKPRAETHAAHRF